MRFTHDPQADAAKIYLVDAIQSGEVKKSHVCDIEQANASIILDFDSLDRLVGIEILGASKILPERMLEE